MILTEQTRGPARILTLNRPQAMNALSGELARALLAALRAAEADAAVRAVIVTGAGERAFCAGADLKERAAMSPDQKWQQSLALRAVNEAVWRSPKAVIAAVNGWCLGGGFELALHCDLRLACGEARFGWPEMTLGSYPGAGGAVVLPRLIGPAAAKSLFLTARRIDAAQAQALGLLEEVVPQAGLLDAALELAEAVARTSPLGLAAVKRVLNEGSGLSYRAASELDQACRRPLEASADYAEGLLAHAEKRPPRFRGA